MSMILTVCLDSVFIINYFKLILLVIIIVIDYSTPNSSNSKINVIIPPGQKLFLLQFSINYSTPFILKLFIDVMDQVAIS